MTDTVVTGERVSEFVDDLQWFMRCYPERVHARHREADQQLLVRLERMIRERAGTLSAETRGGHIIAIPAKPRQLVRDLPEGEIAEFVDEMEIDSYYKGWRLGDDSSDSIITRLDRHFPSMPPTSPTARHHERSRTHRRLRSGRSRMPS